MLLTQAIATQQELYISIQNEIEALLEKQRQIQVYLQQLGTVESQMVSAVSLLTEAIASIKEVCPDEIENYFITVTNLFNEVKLLPSPSPEPSPETETEAETETEPSPEPSPSPSPETETETETETEPSPETETKTETETETETELQSEIDAIGIIISHSKTLPWTAYKKFVSSIIKINTNKTTRSEISAIFEGYLVSQDIEILRGIIAKIEEV